MILDKRLNYHWKVNNICSTERQLCLDSNDEDYDYNGTLFKDGSIMLNTMSPISAEQLMNVTKSLHELSGLWREH